MKRLILIASVYLNIASATIFDERHYYEQRDEEKIYNTNYNVKEASQKLYDSYVNFFKSTNESKDVELYSKYHNNSLCLLSFLSYEEFNVYEAVIDAAESDISSLNYKDNKREQFYAIKKTFPKLEESIENRDLYRTKCQFKVDQKALDEFKKKQKEELKTTNENYDALMKIKNDTHPAFKKFITDIEEKISLWITGNVAKDEEVNNEYKRKVFFEFAKQFTNMNYILKDRLETMFIGECAKTSNALYLKKCANTRPYINIPGEGFRKKICLKDFKVELKKCAYIE